MKTVVGLRVLITGAKGLVGTSLVPILRKEYEVYSTDVTGLDVTDFWCAKEYIKSFKPDVVVHLAALVGGPSSKKDPYNYFRVNIDGTLNILEAMRETNVKHLVYLSSLASYGPNPPLPIDENTPQKPNNPYGISKLCAERIIKNYVDSCGMKAVIMRPTFIYGPNQKEQNPITQITDCMVSGKIFEVWGGGSHTREYLYVTDVAYAILGATRYVRKLVPREHETFVVGSGNPCNMNELITIASSISPFNYKYNHDKPTPFSQRLNSYKINMLLDWFPKVSLKEGIRLVWESKKKN